MEKIVDIPRATQDELRGELRALFQGAIRLTLEMVLEEELKAMVGARRFERIGSRKDHRNGTFLRRLLTSMGQIEVAVPRSRENGSPAGVMGRYQRRTEELDDMIVEAYVSGVSQRKMGEVTGALMGGALLVLRVPTGRKRRPTARAGPIGGSHSLQDRRPGACLAGVNVLVSHPSKLSSQVTHIRCQTTVEVEGGHRTAASQLNS